MQNIVAAHIRSLPLLLHKPLNVNARELSPQHTWYGVWNERAYVLPYDFSIAFFWLSKAYHVLSMGALITVIFPNIKPLGRYTACGSFRWEKLSPNFDFLARFECDVKIHGLETGQHHLLRKRIRLGDGS